MDRLAGIAENVRHTVHVTRSGSQTDHLALFEIGETRLCFRGGAPVSIKEGDELVVVSEPGENGIHTVLAFHNRTLDVRDTDIRDELTGCGCPFFAGLMAMYAVLAAVAGEWLHAVAVLGVAVAAVLVTRRARTVKRETEERLREVHRLLDQGP
jgi:sugar/nucleoside kinase (ribokinase family)